MEVEARGVEGPVVGVPISGLKVAGGFESRGVPETATEVGEEGEVRPEPGDLGDEDGILVDGAEGVVEAGILSLLYDPRRTVDAQPLLRRHRHRASKKGRRRRPFPTR